MKLYINLHIYLKKILNIVFHPRYNRSHGDIGKYSSIYFLLLIQSYLGTYFHKFFISNKHPSTKQTSTLYNFRIYNIISRLQLIRITLIKTCQSYSLALFPYHPYHSFMGTKFQTQFGIIKNIVCVCVEVIKSFIVHQVGKRLKLGDVSIKSCSQTVDFKYTLGRHQVLKTS